MLFYAVVSEWLEEAIGLFVERQMAELMVENWDLDEPDRAGRPGDLGELAARRKFIRTSDPERSPVVVQGAYDRT